MAESTLPMENPYQTPEAELVDEKLVANSKALFIVSVKKLATLYVLTLGLYSVVWFYENFKRIKKTTGSSIWPVPRAIFSVFYTHGLFKRVHETATSKGVSVGWSHASLASAFVVIAILSNVADRVSEVAGVLMLLFLPVSAYILVQVQKTINETLDDPEGQANSRFTIANYVWSVVFVLFWVLVLIGTADTLGLITLSA